MPGARLSINIISKFAKAKTPVDIKAWSNLGLHLAEKLKGAVALQTYRVKGKEEFKQAMRVFLEPDITDPRIKDLYTETVFMDATLNAITLTYSPGENKAEVRKLDVLLDPENNRLERIYMEKEKKNGDSLVTHKLMWNAGHSSQVITLTRVGNQAETVLNERYVWDDRE